MSTVFWNEPEVTILARSEFSSTLPPSTFKEWGTNDPDPCGVTSADGIVEIGGRVCYHSFKVNRKTNAEYIKNILDHGHYSVLEHGYVSFGIQGISRSCSHELVRHRHLSYSQRSQRYCRDLEFVLHPGLTEAQRDWIRIDAARVSKTYHALQTDTPKGKVGQEIARVILPNYVETKMVVSGNLRAWREMIIKRGSEHADAEIRRLAIMILNKLKDIAPNSFQDLEVTDVGTVRIISA